MANKYTSNEASNGYGIGNDAYNSIAKVYDGTNGPSYTITGGIADSASGADTLIVNGTTHDQGATQLAINKALTIKPEVFEGTTITGSHGTAILQINPALNINFGSFIVQNTSTSKLYVATATNSGADANVNYFGTTFYNSGATVAERAQFTFMDQYGWGHVVFNNIKFTGHIKERGYNANNLSISAGRTKIVKFNGVHFDNVIADRGVGGGAVYGIHASLAAGSLGSYKCSVSGMTGKIASGANSGTDLYAVAIYRMNTAAGVSVINNDFTIEMGVDADLGRGILVYSDNASLITDQAVIANNKITAPIHKGYAISVGLNGITNYTTNTKVTGNHVIGTTPNAAASPHGISFNDSSSGTFSSGNLAEKGFVGFLHSKCTTTTQQGDVTKNCAGQHFYLKGCGTSIIDGCVGLSDSNAPIWNDGTNDRPGAFVHLTHQTGTNCTTGNYIRNNLFLCSDISKIGCLAAFDSRSGDTGNPQYGRFENNIYIIPDTVDITSALLFGYLVGNNGVANYTFAQWLTINANAGETTVTGDRIIQLPATEIEAMIADYYNRAAGGSGSGLWLEVAPGINIPL